MKTFTVRDTNEAMYPVYSYLWLHGVKEDSRNGLVLRAPEPVTITYTNPLDRVNLSSIRDANPAFHLLEGVWMLSGSNRLAPIARIVPTITDYSDDGETSNAAYGHRAINHFGVDQLMEVGSLLRHEPLSRQAVVQLWDAADLVKSTKDKACNMQLVFSFNARSNQLDMLIYNRSNDAVWGGVSGANVAHMPFFLEYVSRIAGLSPGSITVVSANLHMYLDNPKVEKLLDHYTSNLSDEPYKQGIVHRLDLFQAHESWMSLERNAKNICNWFEKARTDLALPIVENNFLQFTVVPLLASWLTHKNGNTKQAISKCSNIEASDWRKAMELWLYRRLP